MDQKPHQESPVQFRLRDALIATAAAAVIAALLGPYLRTIEAPWVDKCWAAATAIGFGAGWLPLWASLSRLGVGDPLLEIPVSRPLAWRWMMSDLLASPLWGLVSVLNYGFNSLELSLAVAMLLLYVASYLLTAGLLMSCLWRRYTHAMVTTRGVLVNAYCFVSWDNLELPAEPVPLGSPTFELVINTTFRRGRVALVNEPGLLRRLQEHQAQHATLYGGVGDSENKPSPPPTP